MSFVSRALHAPLKGWYYLQGWRRPWRRSSGGMTLLGLNSKLYDPIILQRFRISGHFQSCVGVAIFWEIVCYAHTSDYFKRDAFVSFYSSCSSVFTLVDCLGLSSIFMFVWYFRRTQFVVHPPKAPRLAFWMARHRQVCRNRLLVCDVALFECNIAIFLGFACALFAGACAVFIADQLIFWVIK